MPKNILALLPSTLNPRYLFPLPFTVESWNKLGVQCVVLLIGNESEFQSNTQSKETIKILKELNANIHFFEPKKIPAVSMSQVC